MKNGLGGMDFYSAPINWGKGEVMNRKMRSWLFIILGSCLLLAEFGCKKEEKGPTGVEGEAVVNVTVKFPDPAQYPLWNNVSVLTFEVVAQDMEDVTATQDVTLTDTMALFTLNIPAGNNRFFKVYAKDTLGVGLFWDSFKKDIEEKKTYNFNMEVKPVGEGEAVVNMTVNLLDPAQYPLWSEVRVLILTATAPGMETVADTQYIAPKDIKVFTLNIQDGPDRLFTLDAKDSLGVVLFWGRFEEDLEPGEDYEFDMDLEAAGGGAADHIKIFRDGLPWESTAMDTMLQREGFTPGTGVNQYEILPSSNFATVGLEVGKDLVIIVNDQNQNFYNNYAASQAKFDNFVYMGGTIFWEACDRGWAEGSILDAGITFPGGVSVDSTYIYDNYNLLYNPNYELVQGLPDTLYGTYSSHETFCNYPQGTQIFTVNKDEGKPTLILYHYGVGWVIITGQPLEYCYDRLPEQTTGYLLPRVVRFFLGKPPVAGKEYYPEKIGLSKRKSSGNM